MKAKLFRKPVVLVTFGGVDSFTEGFAVIESPTLQRYDGALFIEGKHGHESGKTVRGRRILVPLAAVTSITEFDTASEVYEHPRRKSRRSLFTPVRSFLWHQRGRDDIAVKTFAAQVAAEDKAARACFVNQAQIEAGLGEFLYELVHGVERAADEAVAADFGGVGGCDGHGDGFLVDVQTDIMDDWVHGCLVSLLCYQEPSFARGF